MRLTNYPAPHPARPHPTPRATQTRPLTHTRTYAHGHGGQPCLRVAVQQCVPRARALCCFSRFSYSLWARLPLWLDLARTTAKRSRTTATTSTSSTPLAPDAPAPLRATAPSPPTSCLLPRPPLHQRLPRRRPRRRRRARAWVSV